MLRSLPALALVLASVVGCSASTAPPAATAPAASPAGTSARAWGVALDAREFEALTKEKVTLLDVRTPAEFAAGHIQGAQNLDFHSPDFAARVAALPKDGSYALYCRSGNRSGQAMASMKAAGITQVNHLAGGIEAWQGAGFAVVTG